MQKKFDIENLCCPNCANKMQEKADKLEGAKVTINFLTGKLYLEAADDCFEEKFNEVVKIMKSVERKVVIK